MFAWIGINYPAARRGKGSYSLSHSRKRPDWHRPRLPKFERNALSVRFRARDVLFAPGSSELQPRFKTILDDFFPRYLRILDQPQYRNIVSEVRIESYTSSFWRQGASVDESYVANMALSQQRANIVMNQLVASGVPAGAISTSASGDSGLLVDTGPQTNQPKNRRVVIVIQ